MGVGIGIVLCIVLVVVIILIIHATMDDETNYQHTPNSRNYNELDKAINLSKVPKKYSGYTFEFSSGNKDEDFEDGAFTEQYNLMHKTNESETKSKKRGEVDGISWNDSGSYSSDDTYHDYGGSYSSDSYSSSSCDSGYGDSSCDSSSSDCGSSSCD